MGLFSKTMKTIFGIKPKHSKHKRPTKRIKKKCKTKKCKKNQKGG